MIKHNKCIDLVFDIIKKYATKDKPIGQAEILRRLKEDPENDCDRRTVSRALNRLIEKYGKDEDGDWIDENTRLHYTIIPRGDSPILKDYWLEFCYEDDFTDEELMFLMDAVQFSKHVDKSSAEEITKKLVKLSHNQYSGIFEFHTKINEKNVPVRKDFFTILGDINEAIHRQRMVTFYNNVFDTDKNLHPVGDEPVKVSPYRVVVSDGNYYLLCGEKDSNVIKRYRIDRITGLVILEEKSAHSAARINAALRSNEYIVEHCYMNVGETVKVRLEIDKSVLGEVIDSFGTEIKIEPAHHTSNRLIVQVKSSEKDIIDWAMRYGEYAVILDPDYLREEIRERAHLIRYAYTDENQDIEYQEQIKKTERFGLLHLDNIDLNRQYTYRELTGIRRAVFRRNGIKDFSFLSSYNELNELVISHNEIGDPGVISELSDLRILALDMTGITDLNFLRGLGNLNRLSIHEYSVENVEALYSLPNLRILTVNKPVFKLIDKRRLKRADGNPVEIKISNRADRGLHVMSESLPRETSSIMRRDAETMESFATSELTDAAVKSSLVSQINSGTDRFNRDKKFGIVDYSCFGYERIDLYEDIESFAGDEYTWYVTYEGPVADNITDVDEDRIYSISIFKQDHGLKLVGMAEKSFYSVERNDPRFSEIRRKSYPANLAHVKYLLDNQIGWGELSGYAERIYRHAGTINNLISPAMLVNHNVFREIEIDDDGYHYNRTVEGEKKSVKMIAYGHIEFE
ncbi:Predicted DNA-binding transcriptional regulator YafY, contains an HTH and WYL domains [Ruminococcaceae bacterium YAD3003]|nr:Predicted DNA-binding transcriptional regulator YafY, contains an HTH and WYL domains [Ruminococcaceae bacterium YAD3003]